MGEFYMAIPGEQDDSFALRREFYVKGFIRRRIPRS